MIACMQFGQIEVHCSLNGYAWIQWLGMAGSPYSDSKVHTLNLSFLTQAFKILSLRTSVLMEMSLDGNQFPQPILRYAFWYSPYIFSQNPVKSAFKSFRT